VAMNINHMNAVASWDTLPAEERHNQGSPNDEVGLTGRLSYGDQMLVIDFDGDGTMQHAD